MKIESGLVAQIIGSFDELHAELTTEARAIKDRANELIRVYDAVQRRKPPCVMAVKSDGKYLGPKLLWVTYTAKQYNVQGKGLLRFTTEVTGRKNGRYKRTILRKYEPQLEEMLWQCELDAQALRQRIAYWRDVIKGSQEIMNSSAFVSEGH